ncbi:MAG: glycosyl transferase [Gammaproteobacteria bacterium]|jgi:glycosyltransferase involved in cell wall biosynthesis|nr:glycosyl transferase [Gammaproteobacteria bacterium]
MKLSIIIACKNNVKTIEKALLSILEQTYSDIELIVIDAVSTDGTLKLVQYYAKQFNGRFKWLSEPDQGISDAFNKGLKLATGDYIYFLGADDYLWQKDVIEKMLSQASVPADCFICGQIARIKADSEQIVYISSCKPFKKSSLLWRMPLPHQALLTPRAFFKQYGYFDLNNIYSMDYEHLLRAYQNFPEVKMKEVVVAAWREGGIGANKLLKVFAEYHQIKLKNKVAPIWILALINQWILMKYYIKRSLIRFKMIKP